MVRRGLCTGSSFLFCELAVQASLRKTPSGSPPGVFSFPPFQQDVTSPRPLHWRSLFRESPNGLRKTPGWSLPDPGISVQNSRTLALTPLSELTTRSLSDANALLLMGNWPSRRISPHQPLGISPRFLVPSATRHPISNTVRNRTLTRPFGPWFRHFEPASGSSTDRAMNSPPRPSRYRQTAVWLVPCWPR
jgi:hypothetical protein